METKGRPASPALRKARATIRVLEEEVNQLRYRLDRQGSLLKIADEEITKRDESMKNFGAMCEEVERLEGLLALEKALRARARADIGVALALHHPGLGAEEARDEIRRGLQGEQG